MSGLVEDVVVVGAGVSGASIAYRLTQAGYRVVLLEAHAPGAGASGSCDKAIFLQSKRPGLHMRLALASRRMYDELGDELGEDIEFAPHGGMVAIETPQQLHFMRDFVQQQRAAGIDVNLLDREETLTRQPALSGHVLGSTHSPLDAEVNPLALNAALVRAAVRDGAKLMRHTEFLGVEQSNGRIHGVKTDRGTIKARHVVNAAGPYAGLVGERAGIPTPVRPRRGTILIAAGHRRLVHGNLLCAQYVAAKHLTDVGGAKPPPYGIGLSLGQTASGTLLIGGSRQFAGFDKRVPRDVLARIAGHATRLVPELAEVRVVRAMTGFRPSTGDGLPIIEASERLNGWVTAAGHEGDGIALAPITGTLVSALFTGTATVGDFLPHLRADRLLTHHLQQGRHTS